MKSCNTYLWLLFLIIATIFVAWYNQYFIISDSLYYTTYGEKFSTETIESIIENNIKFSWLSYIVICLVIIIRILFTSTCLYAGCFFANIECGFKKLWNIAVYADTAFLIGCIFNTVYLIFFPPAGISDLALNPTSLLYYLTPGHMPAYLMYPIGLLNLFEFLYWAFLAYLISRVFRISLRGGFEFVLKTYGTGIFLIVLIVILILI